MKVSLNWVKDYVKLPDDMDLKRLSFDLTMSTVEVEDAVDLGASFHDMVVGEIKEVLPHPNADKLRICRTDIGGGDIRIPGRKDDDREEIYVEHSFAWCGRSWDLCRFYKYPEWTSFRFLRFLF